MAEAQDSFKVCGLCSQLVDEAGFNTYIYIMFVENKLF